MTRRSPQWVGEVFLAFSIEWPRFPVLTPGGKVSKSRSAGRRVPWLSMNNVNRMPRRVHQQIKIIWRQAARDEAEALIILGEELRYPVRVQVQLFTARSSQSDVGAIIEGSKPLIDGLVEAGVLAGDSPHRVCGIDALPSVPVGLKGETRVELAILCPVR